MAIISVKRLDTQLDQQGDKSTPYQKVLALLCIGELYPIVFIAAFLRLYRIDTALFTIDEPLLFRMARDAIVYGLWPITSNRSNLRSLHPPLSVYLFMIPAAISANPLWAEVMVGLLNVAAVCLAYFFTRRYYGRLTATLTALLYSTSALAIFESRDIWQPNLLPFFTILFLFMLFSGVVDLRKGWFAPALVLLGILYQLHESAVFLVIPLFLAIIFAFKTIRPRDIVIATIVLSILFMPFIYWNFVSHFSDEKILNTVAQKKGLTDNSAFQFYERFLSPYIKPVEPDVDQLSTDPRSVLVASPLSYLRGLLQKEHDMMPQLLICAIAMATIQIVVPRRKTSLVGSTALRKIDLFNWWADLLATPYRKGLVLLLSWQIVPLLLLLHHNFMLLRQYFIILLPGQFILIALLITGIIKWVETHMPNWRVPTRWCMGTMAAYIICAQLIGSISVLIDTVSGHFTTVSYYDLTSLQNALADADQLAQRYHIHRIYISSSYPTSVSLPYLAEQMKTPTTVFNAPACFVLPGSTSEPAIFVSQPDIPLIDMVISHYTKATLVDKPPHLGGNPFKIYILTADPKLSSRQPSRPSEIQLLSSYGQQFLSGGAGLQWVTTRWEVTDSAPTAPRTSYNYSFNFQIQLSGRTKAPSTPVTCGLTSVRTGDQLLVSLKMSKNMPIVKHINTWVSFSTQAPIIFKLGSLKLVSYYIYSINQKKLSVVLQKK